MRAISMILLSLVGVVLASSLSALTHVDAVYGHNPDSGMNNTITVTQYIEQPDLDYWGPDHIDIQNTWSKDGTFQTVNGSQVTIDPPVAQTRIRYLYFGGPSPIPPQWVGMWRVDASFGLMMQYCDSTQIPIQCYWYPTCAAGNAEPCDDSAQGYID